MTKEEIYQRVVDMIREDKGEDFPVELAMSVNDQIAQDSVEVMEFVLNLEDEFSIEISDKAIEGFVTLSDIIDFIYDTKKERS